MNALKRVLIIDSDELTGFLCTEALTAAGYAVDCAANSIEALIHIRNSTYAIVVSSMDIPGLDGIDFYFSIVKQHQYLRDRFIFITGDASGEKSPALARMQRKYLLKPFKVSELVSAVNSIASRPDSSVRPAEGGQPGKRSEERLELVAECSLFEDGIPNQRFLSGKTGDISRHGVKVRYEGELLRPFSFVDFLMEVNNTPFSRRAKVVWAKFLEKDEAAAGLRFDEPIPISAIAGPRAAKPDNNLQA